MLMKNSASRLPSLNTDSKKNPSRTISIKYTCKLKSSQCKWRHAAWHLNYQLYPVYCKTYRFPHGGK
jgi:hypothetical protein